MKKLLVAVIVLSLSLLAWGIWNWDSSPPTISWVEASPSLGRQGKVRLEVLDSGNGLGMIKILLSNSDQSHSLLEETFPMPWPWQTRLKGRSLELAVDSWIDEGLLTEGQFRLEVRLRDHPNLLFWRRESFEQREFLLDLTPPRIRVLTSQHYIRQGGAESIVYTVSEDAVASGVSAGESQFRGYPLSTRGPGAHICLFALSYDQPADTPLRVWAEDAAGNRSEMGFWNKITPVKFRNRDITLPESFMNKVVPEILSYQDEVQDQGDLLSTFLEINGRLRRINQQQIAEISRQSLSQLLWDEAFMQLTNSKVESAFADRRTYYFQGQEVDQQTHLGFDLASVVHSPVEAANSGRVVFADYLGIYGNTVLVDHGLGLISLYGHLSSIEVQKGQEVERGETLGRTGQTGLAGGDHLHFSMILQGTEVNPLEWWDSRWVSLHVLSRQTGLD